MDFEEKKRHLDSLEEVVRLTTKKLNLHLNVLLAIVSQQTNYTKFKTREEFFEELPMTEQQLQDTHNLIKSMLAMLKAHAQSKNIDLSAWSEKLESEYALSSSSISGVSPQSTLPEGNPTEHGASHSSGTANSNNSMDVSHQHAGPLRCFDSHTSQQQIDFVRSIWQSSPSSGIGSVIASSNSDISHNKNNCSNMEVIHRSTASAGRISASSSGAQNDALLMNNVGIGNIINPSININYCYNFATEPPTQLATPKTIFSSDFVNQRIRSALEDITPPPSVPTPASPLQIPTAPTPASPLHNHTTTTASPLLIHGAPTPPSPSQIHTVPTLLSPVAAPMLIPTVPTPASPLKIPVVSTPASPLKVPTIPTLASPLKMPVVPTPASPLKMPTMVLSTMEQPPAIQDTCGDLDNISLSPQSITERMEFSAETSPVTHIQQASPIGPAELSAGIPREFKHLDILKEFDCFFDSSVADILDSDPAISICSPASVSCLVTYIDGAGPPENALAVSESPPSEDSEVDRRIEMLLKDTSVHSQREANAQKRMNRDWETFVDGIEAYNREDSGLTKTSNNFVQECQLSENLNLGKPYDVYLSHIERDNVAWLQMHDCRVLELQEMLRQRISLQTLDRVNIAYPGLKVVALYKDDGCYYRAIIKEFLDSGAIEVFFIDYGNSEVVEQKDLCRLPQELDEWPAMASSFVIMQVDNYHAKFNSQEDGDTLRRILQPFIDDSTPLKAVFEQLPEGLGCNVPSVQFSRYGVALFTQEFFTQSLNSSACQTQMLSNNHPSNYQRSVRTKTTACLKEGSTFDDIQELSVPHVNTLITPQDINERPSSHERREMQTHNTAQEMMGPPRIGEVSAPPTEEFGTTYHPLRQGEKIISQGNMNHINEKQKDKVWIPLDDEEMMDLTKSCTDDEPQVSRSFDVKSPPPNSIVKDTCSAPMRTRSSTRNRSRKEKSSDNIHSLVSLTKPQIVLSAELHPVILSYVEGPDRFYLHLINNETAEIDRFHDTMTNHYRFNNEILHLKQLPHDSIWAVRSKDSSWFRGLVLANLTSFQGTKSSRSVKFRLVDYGDEMDVKMNDVRVLHENFTLMPMLAIPCRLSHLEASNVGQETISAGLGKETFEKQCGGYKAVLHAEFTSVDASGIYKVILQNSDGNVINFLNLDASSSVLSNQETQSKVPQGRGRTSKRRKVIKQCLNPIKLPKSGTVLVGVVSKVFSPSKFYIYFHEGLEDVRNKQKTDEAPTTETLFTLTAAMFKHYEKTLPEPVDCLPVKSELKVVREEDGETTDYCRVRVLDMKKENGVVLVKVFFIDHGEESWVRQEHLRPLEPKFAELAPQAILCSLAEIEPPEKGWKEKDTKQFKELTSDVSLVVHVMSIDTVQERLSVVLYDTEHGSDININEMMKTSLRDVNN